MDLTNMSKMRKKCILVVDDELPVLELIRLTLEREGFRVTPKTSGDKALEAFCNDPEKYDLLVTDMIMHGITGYKLAFAVRTIRPDIPIIACTDFSSEIEIMSGEPKINNILMKPFDKTALTETVHNTLNKAMAQTDHHS